MSNKIRWGLLSTAQINDSLIGAIRQAERSELVAVASRNIAKAQTYASMRGIPKAYGSYEALLADTDVDVVYNSLPNTLHCEWTTKAAEAGKHVLCEKPIATTLAELLAVEAAASTHKVTVFEGLKHLHHPTMRRLQEIIMEGQLGTLQFINCCFGFCLSPEDKDNIRLNPSLGGGALWDTGVYANSLAIVMAHAGPPAEVWANQVIGETRVDVSMIGQMRFTNGVVAQISCSFLFPSKYKCTTMIGSKGMVQFGEPWSVDSRLGGGKLVFTNKRGVEDMTFSIHDPFLSEVETMEACIIDRVKPIIPLSLSRVFLQSLLGLYEAASSGQVVGIQYIGNSLSL